MDTNKFVNRHVGISAEDIPAMLETIGVKSLDVIYFICSKFTRLKNQTFHRFYSPPV